ncbi:MAG: hypothetical protein K6T86_00615 [Pirellulales bacterium]|nr:hypothetical protein [Pirellulales bacterium]
MWCSKCQQEVPGVRNSASGVLACVRCGQEPDQVPPSSATATLPTPEERDQLLRNLEHWSDHPLLAELDDWELGEQLRHVERLLAVDPPGKLPAPRHSGFSPGEKLHERENATSRRRLGSSGSMALRAARLLAWLAIALGVAALVCGAVLLALAQLRGRSDLWGLGIPLFAVGQLGVVIGLVCEADFSRRVRRPRGKAGRRASQPSRLRAQRQTC